MISRLRNAAPGERVSILENQYQKNCTFFQDTYPVIAEFIARRSCPYELNITDQFVDVTHTVTGQRSTQGMGLDTFSEFLGAWTHHEWIDLLQVNFFSNQDFPLHYETFSAFFYGLQNTFGEYADRVDSGHIDLKNQLVDRGKRFSPPVVFLGIFHGLHIDYYLSRTEISRCFLVEPEADRFEVSCYFLDYPALYKRFGRLYIEIGGCGASDVLASFLHFDSVTPQVWTRVLAAYPSLDTPQHITTIKVQQQSAAALFFPVDIELKGLENTLHNLQEKLPVLTKQCVVSSGAPIVLVASGPSLENELRWLKTYRNRLIIFAVHSAVSVLARAGIKPDFQFSMETLPIEQCTGMVKLELHADVPLVAYCRADRSWVQDPEQMLLINEKSKAQLKDFTIKLSHTHPSTTNMALSFALYLQPERIYLAGCDFGYKDLTRCHAKGTWRDTLSEQAKKNSKHARAELFSVPPNFAGSGTVLSSLFLAQTRRTAEKAIAESSVKVINLSDGAYVSGAVAQRSGQIEVPQATDVRNDITRIRQCFAQPIAGVNYRPYTLSGSDLYKTYTTRLIDDLTLSRFSWTKLSSVLDQLLDKKLGHFSDHPHDWRMDVYSRIFNDLLRFFYCALLFTTTEEETIKVYSRGLILLKQCVKKLEWPKHLDP